MPIHKNIDEGLVIIIIAVYINPRNIFMTFKYSILLAHVLFYELLLFQVIKLSVPLISHVNM